MSMISLEKPIFKAVGVMCGTSMDAIDVALIETDGENHVKPLRFEAFSMPPVLKNELLSLITRPQDILNHDLSEITKKVTLAHVEAVEIFLKGESVDIIGFHGQTVLHRPQDKITVQLFNGQMARDALTIPLVCDFRARDVSEGGQGAPLVPIYHMALSAGLELPCIFLNLGGVANMTYIGEPFMACDTGPASALIDDFMRLRTGLDYDKGGLTASKGIVRQAIVNKALAHPFFSQPFPKSLDRNAFALDVSALNIEDGAATLTAFTVQSLALALSQLPPVKAVYVCGGGRLNSFLMGEMAKVLACEVLPIENLGLNGDSIEAECFAYLAVRSLKNLPISFPLTTGVKEPLTGGHIFF